MNPIRTILTDGVENPARWLLGCWIAVPLSVSLAVAATTDTAAREGHASVSPTTGISGEFGTWTVRYVAGPGGIAQGGGIRVELPDSWHSGPRNSANRLQVSDPVDEHYLTANCSRRGVKVEIIVEEQTAPDQKAPGRAGVVNEDVPPGSGMLVKHAKSSLDGRLERYVFVVRVHVVEGALREGDVLEVVYGDRSLGSPGLLAAAIATDPEPILIAVDARGDGRFALVADSPMIQAVPGEAVEMLLLAPSQAVVGKPATCRVVLLDKQRNAVVRSADVLLRMRTGEADLPAQVRVRANEGHAVFEITPSAPGVVRLVGETTEMELAASSNPMEVTSEEPATRLFWGDLHSHGELSWDGVGQNPFTYAREVSGLDFYALTDHANEPRDGGTRGLSEATWPAYAAAVEAHHDAPHFVTLHAYECSFGRPYGHHNVFFRDQPGPLVYPSRNTLPELWAMLEAGHTLTIPHHTGKFPSGIEFSPDEPELRRNFEIYSGHGLSEYYDPDHPLSFEHSRFTSPSKSLEEPTFAQDVWMRGMMLSAVASSDDHRAQPGQPHYGLTAVRAPALTRNEIFQALHDRRTYGTTGARILLSLTVDGTPMGQLATIADKPVIEIRASGTDTIESIELLRYGSSSDGFAVIQTWRPGTLDFEGRFTDPAYAPGAIYYVRVKQQHLIRGRAVMAWSSPVWTRRP